MRKRKIENHTNNDSFDFDDIFYFIVFVEKYARIQNLLVLLKYRGGL